jgi:DNA-binding NarL/FixJ family response regulator
MRKQAVGNRIRIAIVDNPMMRRGVTETLSEPDDFELVGIGGSAHDAMELAKNEHPDLILLDIALPGGDIEATQEIVKSYPKVKVVILTVRDDCATVNAAFGGGCSRAD